MDRQDRDRYDYGRYDGYNNDEHYHGTRNLTNEFERNYQHDRGHRDDRDLPRRSYHEGNDMEDTYQRLRRDEDSFRDRADYRRDYDDSDRNYYGNGRDGYGGNQDNFRGNMGMYKRDRDMERHGAMRQGYDTNNRNEDRNYGVGRDDMRRTWNDRDYGNYADRRRTGINHDYNGRSSQGGDNYMSNQRGRSTGNFGDFGSMDDTMYGRYNRSRHNWRHSDRYRDDY